MTFLVLSFWIYTLVLVFGARLGYDSHEVVMIVTSCLIYESFGITCPCVCMSNLWSVCLFYQNPWHDHILYIFIMICMNCLWHPMNFLCLYNLYSERTVHRVSVFLASDMVRYCPYHIFGVSDVSYFNNMSDTGGIGHGNSKSDCWCGLGGRGFTDCRVNGFVDLDVGVGCDVDGPLSNDVQL
jgi:hypothetical protein